MLFLGHHLAPGGAEMAFVELVNRLESVRPIPTLVRREGELLRRVRPDLPLFDLEVPAAQILEQGEPRRWEEVADHGGADPVERNPPLPAAAISLLRKSYRLAHLARATGARVVSTFLHKSHMIAAATRLLWQRDLRIVANVHSITSRSAAFLDPGRPEHHHLDRILGLIYPRVDLLLAVSRAVECDLASNFGVDPERMVVVPPPLDLPRIRASARREPEGDVGWLSGDRRVLAVGRLVREKGFDVLLRAFARLGGEGARLAILGEGPERRSLENLARELGVVERLELPGYRADARSWMARADLFVLSSRLDAFPTVLGEALTLGVPVVATSCSSGVLDYLEHGACGLLVPPESSSALASGMRHLLEDRRLRERLRERGLRRVEAFRSRSIVERYERALERIL